MTLQDQFNELISERAGKDYFNNKVVLYQKIFERVQTQVNEQRRAKNTKKLTEQLKLANLVLKAKAIAWAQRSKKEFLAHIDGIIEKQQSFTYKDNPYTEPYLKHLLNEKERLGY